jgi:hypothetical protein
MDVKIKMNEPCQLPNYSRFIFIWWFNYLNGFNWSKNQVGRWSKILCYIPLIGFFISLSTCVAGFGFSLVRNYWNITKTHFHKETVFSPNFWYDLHYLHVIITGTIGLIILFLERDKIKCLLEDVDKIQCPVNHPLRRVEEHQLTKNLNFNLWQTHICYLIVIALPASITAFGIYKMTKNSYKSDPGVYPTYIELGEPIQLILFFSDWHIAHQLYLHVFFCWIITKKFQFINNYLIELQIHKIKPNKNIFNLLQRGFRELLSIIHSVDQIFLIIIPNIYFVLAFATISHGLSALYNCQRNDPGNHSGVVMNHVFFVISHFPILLYCLKQSVDVKEEAKKTKIYLEDYIHSNRSELSSFLAQQYENTKDLLSRKAFFTFLNSVHIDRLVIIKTILFMATTYLLLIRITHSFEKLPQRNDTNAMN